jgi:hypothetical protein
VPPYSSNPHTPFKNTLASLPLRPKLLFFS